MVERRFCIVTISMGILLLVSAAVSSEDADAEQKLKVAVLNIDPIGDLSWTYEGQFSLRMQQHGRALC